MLLKNIVLLPILNLGCANCGEGSDHPPVTLPPQVCKAKAFEKDGKIQIRVAIRRVSVYSVSRLVRIQSEKGTIYRTAIDTHYEPLTNQTVLIADGKQVQVFRKKRQNGQSQRVTNTACKNDAGFSISTRRDRSLLSSSYRRTRIDH